MLFKFLNLVIVRRTWVNVHIKTDHNTRIWEWVWCRSNNQRDHEFLPARAHHADLRRTFWMGGSLIHSPFPKEGRRAHITRAQATTMQHEHFFQIPAILPHLNYNFSTSRSVKTITKWENSKVISTFVIQFIKHLIKSTNSRSKYRINIQLQVINTKHDHLFENS